jgi:hypothetical protein
LFASDIGTVVAFLSFLAFPAVQRHHISNAR